MSPQEYDPFSFDEEAENTQPQEEPVPDQAVLLPGEPEASDEEQTGSTVSHAAALASGLMLAYRACKILGLAAPKVSQWVSQGKVPATRVGRNVYVRLEDVIAEARRRGVLVQEPPAGEAVLADGRENSSALVQEESPL